MKASVFILVALLSLQAYGETRVIELKRGQEEALSYSKRIQAQEAEYQGALRRAAVLRSDNFPQFYIDGQYRYVTEVPEMSLPAPINKKVELGQTKNYSAGVNLSYLVTDFGQTSKNISGANEEAIALEQSKKNLELQLQLKISQLYLKLRFQVSQMRALFDSWSLAKEQEKDMARRLNSGTSSRLDYVKATKESLSFKLKLLQFQREFSEALLDWCILTGQTSTNGEFAKAVPEELSKNWMEPASVSVRIIPTVFQNEISELSENHPQLLQLNHLKLSHEFKSQAITRS